MTRGPDMKRSSDREKLAAFREQLHEHSGRRISESLELELAVGLLVEFPLPDEVLGLGEAAELDQGGRRAVRKVAVQRLKVGLGGERRPAQADDALKGALGLGQPDEPFKIGAVVAGKGRTVIQDL